MSSSRLLPAPCRPGWASISTKAMMQGSVPRLTDFIDRALEMARERSTRPSVIPFMPVQANAIGARAACLA